MMVQFLIFLHHYMNDRQAATNNKGRNNQDLRTTLLSSEAIMALETGYRQQGQAATGCVSQSLFKTLQFSGNSARTAVIMGRFYRLC